MRDCGQVSRLGPYKRTSETYDGISGGRADSAAQRHDSLGGYGGMGRT